MKKRLLILSILSFTISFLALVGICQARDLDSPSILKGYWRLNSNAADYSGHGNDGTWAGDEAYITDSQRRTVGDFGGDDDGIDSGTTPLIGTGDFSVGMWVKPDTNGIAFMSMFHNGAASFSYDLWIANHSGTLNVRMDNDDEITTGSFESGLWHYVVITRGGSDVFGYINGSLVEEATSSVDISDSGGNILIGRDGQSYQWWDGSISEVRIYNIALTADEIQYLYELNLPEYSAQAQPYNLIPDTADSSLVYAGLNRAVVGAADLSSLNNDGVATDVGWNEVGGEFDGSSSYLTIENTAGEVWGSGAEDLTISTWFMSSDVTTLSRIFAHAYGGTPGTRFYIDIGSTSNKLGVYIGSYYNNSVVDISNDIWYQVVCVYDYSDGTITIYLDGEEVLSPTSLTIGTDKANLSIGSLSSSAEFFPGKIKDVRIYNEAKSASWVAHEYSKAVPEDDLVLHVVNGDKDLSRYDHTLTNSGAILGDGMVFDGTDSVIDTGSDMILTGADTICAWVNTAAGYGEGNVGRIVDNGKTLFNIWSDRLVFKSDGSSTIFSATEISSDKWFYAVVTRTASGVANFYVDGVLSGTPDQDSGTPENGTGNLLIGNDSGSDYTFDGTIKDLRIYNEAKSADWIKLDYERTKGYY